MSDFTPRPHHHRRRTSRIVDPTFLLHDEDKEEGEANHTPCPPRVKRRRSSRSDAAHPFSSFSRPQSAHAQSPSVKRGKRVSWTDEVEEYGYQEEGELRPEKSKKEKVGKGIGGKRGRPRKAKDGV